MADNAIPRTFRALAEAADRKFARVRDVPAYGRAPNLYIHKVFKAYLRLWRYQQENRQKLVESGLQRWEIGEIASRIGQLYFGQYTRTSEARFLLEAYIFYEAILNRGYFEGSKGSPKDRGVRFKELRFYARFLLVSLILNRSEMVEVLVERFKSLVDDSIASFRETNFKEWKLLVQEIARFIKSDSAFINGRPVRYCALLDSYPASLPYVARFHAKKVLKFRDALLTSYHRNEVKFAELALDTFRMLQCLEWEPTGSFYQKHPHELHENGAPIDHSATSGFIDMHLAADMTDPTLPLNPRKAVLYRPSATQLIAAIATICEELSPDSLMLLYISASGQAGHTDVSQMESSGVLRKSSKVKVVSHTSHESNRPVNENHVNDKGNPGQGCDDSLWLGPCRNGGSNSLYPGDIIPFTRRPLFLIIDSNNSHAFKNCNISLRMFVSCYDVIGQWASDGVVSIKHDGEESVTLSFIVKVLHGAERGEPAALLLSPLRSFKTADLIAQGSQFTLFLTSPLLAFCQLVGLTCSGNDADVCKEAENMLSTSFSEWERILCKSTTLDLVWAQVLSDPFLRRLILRFIFCRSVLTLFGPREDNDQYLPVCLPRLPDSVSPNSEVVESAVFQLANHLAVADRFH